MIHSEPGYVRISFMLVDRAGDPYNTTPLDDIALFDRQEDLLGTFMESCDEYVNVCYDSLEEAQAFAEEDSKMLDNILNERKDDDERDS